MDITEKQIEFNKFIEYETGIKFIGTKKQETLEEAFEQFKNK